MDPMILAIIICIIVIVNYVWGKISLCITAMTSVAVFLLTGLVSPNDVLGNIGNSNVVMILSMFVVAAGFNKTKFVRSLANSLNNVAKGNLTVLLAGYVVITIILSQFILSPATVLSIVGPLLITSAKGMDISPSKVVMPVAMASIITTGALPVGSGATVAAELTAYLETGGYTATQMGLLDPMYARLPIVIVIAIYCIFFAHKFAPDAPILELSAGEERKAGGPAPKELNQVQEVLGYVIFFGTTLALIFSSQVGQPTWVITLVGAALMCVTGVLSEKEAITAIPWWMGGLIVGALTMGSALTNTGADVFIGDALAGMIGGITNPYLFGLVFFIVPYVLTQLMANRTVMMVFIPIAGMACNSLGVNPEGIAILVQQACLAAFITPMATPAVPMFMGLGGYDLKSVAKQSIIPTVILCIVAVGWIMTIFPMY